MIIPLTSTFLMFLLLTIALSTGCPPSCICKWRNGKQTVECIGKGLLIIPEGTDTATQVLDFSGNNFQYIQRESFLKIGLINLQKLFFSRGKIKIIEDDAFKGLTNLVELDLSENMLETVPTEALLNCPSLMRLSLSKNPISSLDRLAFNHLSFLTTLDLSGCEITEVHEAAFSSLYSLEWIDISRNKIRSFPDMQLFPNRLKGMQLHDNPWTCDCHIRTFNSWLKKDVVPILISPVCREPRKFRGIPVRGLNESELACTPEMNPTSFYFEIQEEKNITLLCQVKSVPSAKISWIFKGQVLQNNTEPIPGLQLVYFIEEGDEEKESSLFIYNIKSESNGTFYCLAENPAGVTLANYTLIIILKRAPEKLEEKPDFPIDIISIFLASGLVLLSLCFVALIMALIKNHSKSKRRKRELEKKENIVPLPASKINAQKKLIMKPTDNHSVIAAGGKKTEIVNRENYQITEPNPDIINGINSDQNSTSEILLFKNKTPQKGAEHLSPNNYLPGATLVMPNRAQHFPILVNPATMNRKFMNRQRTQPYLKPTLTGKFRPISAPTFERYVETYDLRYTADGYPVRHDGTKANSCFARRPIINKIPYSETSSPKMINNLKEPAKSRNELAEIQTQRKVNNILIFNDDVHL